MPSESIENIERGVTATADDTAVEHREYDGNGTVDFSDDQPDDDPRFRFSFRRLWKFCGPAWLMSLAYLDPGNLESDLQMGAYANLELWWATVMGFFLQELSARLALVTGLDLAQHVRKGYPRWLNYVIYVMMEIAVIGSDVQ